MISTPSEGIGIKPSDLLLLALASCAAVDVVEILFKKRIPTEWENMVYGIAMLLLIGLMLFVNIMDFVNPAQLVP